ncbi:MAG TPA: prepilin-type N-terminal cleavage/methylation domain-containing protein [candidate division Zixibacteria bacterium]|jgi:prepilin-type N-terminal cleavage/methylation domain-containing protein
MRRFRNLNRDRAGFTLIELVIIIVILGIIAGVAIPRYFDMVSEAKKSSCKGALGGLRSAISIWYGNEALTTGTAGWPAIDSLRTPGVVLMQAIPPNPYQVSTSAPDSIVTGVTKGVIVGTRGGWAYKPTTGEVWPNTNVASENQF